MLAVPAAGMPHCFASMLMHGDRCEGTGSPLLQIGLRVVSVLRALCTLVVPVGQV